MSNAGEDSTVDPAVLGDGATTGSYTPVGVQGIDNATYVTSAYTYSCALLTAGALKCWGRNQYGQLGDGTTTYSNVPVAVTGFP